MNDLKYYINVPLGRLRKATEFYIDVFGAKRCTSSSVIAPANYIELELPFHDGRLVITSSPIQCSKSILELVTGSELASKLAERFTTEKLSPFDLARGVTMKFVDPHGVVWLVTEFRKESTYKPCHCSVECSLPRHVPALCLEVKTFLEMSLDQTKAHLSEKRIMVEEVENCYCLHLGVTPDRAIIASVVNDALDAATKAPQTLSRLQKDVFEIRELRNSYELQDCLAFANHENLRHIVKELLMMNSYLQGLAIVQFVNPCFYACNGVSALTASVYKLYGELLDAFTPIPPADPSDWARPVDLRKRTAGRVRQLLKALQQARKTMNNKISVSPYRELVRDQELVDQEREMEALIYREVDVWRLQDLMPRG